MFADPHALIAQMDRGFAAHVSNWDDVMLVLITGFPGPADAALAEQLRLPLAFTVPHVPHVPHVPQTHRHIDTFKKRK